MTAWLSLLVLLSWKQDLVGGIRILDIRVPAHAAEGGTALLGCHFDMEGDELYSIKWYKDAREFYRYVPNNRIPNSHFPTSGITVDVSRSSSTVVALTNLKQESSGVYRCEVSGEAPKFNTVHEERYITIHYLPKTSPTIMGLERQYDFGDRAVLNCTSPGSRPESQLKWLVNGKPVPKEHLRGPWYRISQERPDATETILELRFTVMPKHFKNGVLSIKCQAVIAPLYHDEVVYQVLWDDNVYSTMADPIESTEPNHFFLSPIYNEIKQVGLPPLDKYTSVETVDNSSNQEVVTNHGRPSNAQDLVFKLLIILLTLFKLLT